MALLTDGPARRTTDVVSTAEMASTEGPEALFLQLKRNLAWSNAAGGDRRIVSGT